MGGMSFVAFSRRVQVPYFPFGDKNLEHICGELGGVGGIESAVIIIVGGQGNLSFLDYFAFLKIINQNSFKEP